jgi:uncharacterized membrane protein (UPF0127 family)
MKCCSRVFYDESLGAVRILGAMTERYLPIRVMTARGFAARQRGLLGRDELDPDEGLWISPCKQVHTFGMRFPIDVAFLDAGGRLLHAVHEMQPGRLSRFVWRARGALELAAGQLHMRGLSRGDVLRWG